MPWGRYYDALIGQMLYHLANLLEHRLGMWMPQPQTWPANCRIYPTLDDVADLDTYDLDAKKVAQHCLNTKTLTSGQHIWSLGSDKGLVGTLPLQACIAVLPSNLTVVATPMVRLLEQ